MYLSYLNACIPSCMGNDKSQPGKLTRLTMEKIVATRSLDSCGGSTMPEVAVKRCDRCVHHPADSKTVTGMLWRGMDRT